jgi:hypothetical protein
MALGLLLLTGPFQRAKAKCLDPLVDLVLHGVFDSSGIAAGAAETSRWKDGNSRVDFAPVQTDEGEPSNLAIVTLGLDGERVSLELRLQEGM